MVAGYPTIVEAESGQISRQDDFAAPEFAIAFWGLRFHFIMSLIAMPNTSLEPTAVTPFSPLSRAASQFGGGSVLGR